jgi:hypothetical protein
MSGLFTAISSRFSPAVVLGALLPATVFVILCWLWLLPMLPLDIPTLSRFETIMDTQWKVVTLTAIVTLVAALLHVLNTPVVRLYEGYPWKDGPLGRFKIRKNVKRLQTLIDARNKGRALRPQLQADKERLATVQALLIEVANEISLSFPREASVLPTRLGNAIRSFENYPSSQYNISAIPLWAHFAVKMAPSHAAAIEDAKTSVDVSINFSFLLMILAVAITAAGFVYPIPFVAKTLVVLWVLKISVLALSSYLAYVAAIGRAVEWGGGVRSVFDLYRWDVLKGLGFTVMPADMVTERELWKTISMQISRGDPPDVGPVLRYDSGTYVLPASNLRVTRGLSAPNANRATRTVTASVRNEAQHAVSDITLVETIPQGQQYVWGTMQLDGEEAEVYGTNPYRIDIGCLNAGETATVTYEMGV